MSQNKKSGRRTSLGATKKTAATNVRSGSSSGGRGFRDKGTSNDQGSHHKTSSRRDADEAVPVARPRPTGTGEPSRGRSRLKKAGVSSAPSVEQPPRRRVRGGTESASVAAPAPIKQAVQAKQATPPRDPVPPRQVEIRSLNSDPDDAPSAITYGHTDDSGLHDPYPTGALDVGMLGIGSPFFPPDMDYEGTSENDFEETSPGTSFADDPSVEMRIREIEERLDGLMAGATSEALDDAPVRTVDSVAPASADHAVDAAREVLESDYYRKHWGRGSMRDLAQEVDEFGMDPNYEARLRPILDFMFKRYFRVEVEGIRNVPAEGRAVVVANHSGALPFDGVMLREAIRQRHPGRDDLRWLAEDFSFYLPFLGVTLNRIGAVRACPENAERLLAKEHLLGVFPEGAEGIKKLYKDRYRLQRFGRGGFVRLCLKTRSPIVPCAIIGAEETNPILYRFDNLSKLIGLDYLPITPTFPFLGPLGLLPAPTKWRIVFGEPIQVDEYGPQAAQDHVLVGRLSERVRTSINDLLEAALRRRKSIWL